MGTNSITADKLRSCATDLGVDLAGGDTAGYVRADTHFNLGAIAIGYDEERTVYDEDTFPGVVYPLPEMSATIIVSGDGTIAVVDAADESHAESALAAAVEPLEELGLILDGVDTKQVVPAEEIPFAADPPHVETIGYAEDDD